MSPCPVCPWRCCDSGTYMAGPAQSQHTGSFNPAEQRITREKPNMTLPRLGLELHRNSRAYTHIYRLLRVQVYLFCAVLFRSSLIRRMAQLLASSCIWFMSSDNLHFCLCVSEYMMHVGTSAMAHV